MRTISLKLNGTLDEKLTEVARKQGISKSLVIRNAVIAYLKENNDFPSESCFKMDYKEVVMGTFSVTESWV